jgi:hypothetical protein
MKQPSAEGQVILRSSDTLFRPTFMLEPSQFSRLSKTQLGQRKAVNTTKLEETNELTEIAWWQDR